MAGSVKLRYEFANPDDVIPSFVWLGTHPYSGPDHGSVDIVDWGGNFAKGRPHGEFYVCFGDRMTVKLMFEHGVEVKPPRGGG